MSFLNAEFEKEVFQKENLNQMENDCLIKTRVESALLEKERLEAISLQAKIVAWKEGLKSKFYENQTKEQLLFDKYKTKITLKVSNQIIVQEEKELVKIVKMEQKNIASLLPEKIIHNFFEKVIKNI